MPPYIRLTVLVNAADLGMLGALDTVGLGFCRAQVHCSSPSPYVEKKFKTATLNQKRNENVRSKSSSPVFIATCWD